MMIQYLIQVYKTRILMPNTSSSWSFDSGHDITISLDNEGGVSSTLFMNVAIPQTYGLEVTEVVDETGVSPVVRLPSHSYLPTPVMAMIPLMSNFRMRYLKDGKLHQAVLLSLFLRRFSKPTVHSLRSFGFHIRGNRGMDNSR